MQEFSVVVNAEWCLAALILSLWSVLLSQGKLVSLTRVLEEAHQVIRDGEEIAPLLNVKIKKLEADEKDLRVT